MAFVASMLRGTLANAGFSNTFEYALDNLVSVSSGLFSYETQGGHLIAYEGAFNYSSGLAAPTGEVTAINYDHGNDGSLDMRISFFDGPKEIQSSAIFNSDREFLKFALKGADELDLQANPDNNNGFTTFAADGSFYAVGQDTAPDELRIQLSGVFAGDLYFNADPGIILAGDEITLNQEDEQITAIGDLHRAAGPTITPATPASYIFGNDEFEDISSSFASHHIVIGDALKLINT